MTGSTVPTTYDAPLGLPNAASDELGQTFDGELIRPSDAAYDRARRPWNGMIDRRPALVVRLRSPLPAIRARLCGNFGIVTGFEFRLPRFGPDILSVDLAYPLDDGPAAIRALLSLAEDAPDALTVGGAVVTARPSPELLEAFHGAPVVWVSYVYADDVEMGKRFIPRLRVAGEPLLELVEVLPYVQLQRAADQAQRPGQRQYARSHFIQATPDTFIEAFLSRGGHDPNVAANASLGHLGGAVARSGPEEGAFSGRGALFDLVVGSTWEDPGHDADRLSAARAFGESLVPPSTGRSYVNAIDGEETDKVRAAFGASTYDRLAAVKDRYDPGNVFHLNQNVRPSGA